MSEEKQNIDKTFLFIDGTNFYAGQYELFGPKKYLDFSLFLEQIEKKLNIFFDRIYFYASYSPKPKEPSIKQKLYLKNEALFYRSARQIKKVIFFTGYRSKTSGQEKEVDVKLTADLVSLAFLDKYNMVYLSTGDADFLQALFSINNFHRKTKAFLLCLENKIMYKGAFYFKTYIASFTGKTYNFNKKQKITILDFDRSKLTKDL